MSKLLDNISKYLSFILRHRPDDIGLVLDEHGYAVVDELLVKSISRFDNFDKSLLAEVVADDKKGRYEYNEDFTKIRACQGHSIEVNLQLVNTEPPEFLYHGTSKKSYDLIKSSGIQKRNRHHVHLTDNSETATIVGARHGKPIVITIPAKKMYDSGIEFYKSANGVWLVDFVDVKYLG